MAAIMESAEKDKLSAPILKLFKGNFIRPVEPRKLPHALMPPSLHTFEHLLLPPLCSSWENATRQQPLLFRHLSAWRRRKC